MAATSTASLSAAAATTETAATMSSPATTAAKTPCVFDLDTGEGSVGHLFNCLSKQDPTSPAFNQSLLKLFRKHPYVRERKRLDFYGQCDVATCSHSFQVYGFAVDTHKFAKWIKAGGKDGGKQYKHIAGGVSDDGLYTLSEVRAMSVITFAQKSLFFFS